jgi:hypothetical protein
MKLVLNNKKVKPKVERKPTDVTCLLNETTKLNIKFSAVSKPIIT